MVQDETPSINIDLNTVKIFRISDLVGSSSTRPNLKERSGRNKRKGQTVPVLETSSFKISNRIAIHGSKPKQKKVRDSDIDLLWLHEEKRKHHEHLQTVVLPEKMLILQNLPTSIHGYTRKRKKLEMEIQDIRDKKEENLYKKMTDSIVEEYRTMLTESEESCTMKLDTSGGITQFISKYDNISKQLLTEKYCRIVNNGYLVNTTKLKFDNTVCVECGAETMYSDGFISCTECGLASDKSIHEFRLSYHDYREILVKSPFSYKRMNRFQELLSTRQAKDNSEIPEYVMNLILKEINKEQNVDMDDLDHNRIRKVLRRLSLTQYYEHIPHILNKLSNISPLVIEPAVEEQVQYMFELIQGPFETVRARLYPSRSSFLSYDFVLYKFFELLDLHEYKKSFTLLKSADKLRVLDALWQGICELLSWEFIASI